MTVKDLMEHLALLNQESEVLISCEGGCVVDSEIKIIPKGSKVVLEI